MNLIAIGCNYRTAPIELRERLAFDDVRIIRALTEFSAATAANRQS